MTTSGLTREERAFRMLMWIWGVLFTFGALWFLFMSDQVVSDSNRYSALVGLRGLEARPGFGVEEFWLILGVAMMAAIATAAWIAASDVRRYRILALPIVAAKMTSSILGVVFFGLSGSGPYLVIFCTDFPMGVITLWLYWRVAAHAPEVDPSPSSV